MYYDVSEHVSIPTSADCLFQLDRHFATQFSFPPLQMLAIGQGTLSHSQAQARHSHIPGLWKLGTRRRSFVVAFMLT